MRFRVIVVASMLTIAMLLPASGLVEGARTKIVSGGGYGCNFGSLIVSVGWEKRGGKVDTVRWTRYVQDGPDLVEQVETSLSPDDMTSAHVTWENMAEGYYSFSVELLTRTGTVLASYDWRPTTQYCYQWP